MPKQVNIIGAVLLGLSGLFGLAGPAAAQDNPVQDMIQKAIASGASEVVVPPGTYQVKNGAHFSFRNVRNFTIRADGVNLVFNRRKTAITISNCENLEIRGWTMDYNPLPFTQGTIIASGPGWSYTDVELHQGYPATLSSGARIEVKDKATRLLKPNLYMIYGTPVEMIRPGVMRVQNTQSFSGKVNIGDYLVDHYREEGGYHGIEMTGSRNVTFRNIVFHSSPGYALHTYECTGTKVLNFDVALGPTPPGATEPRLRTLHADGFHFENDRTGPHIEDCLIEANGDDGIAIHGDMAKLTQAVNGGTTVQVDNLRFLHIQPGDTLIGHALNGGGFLAKAVSSGGNSVTLDRAVTAATGSFLYNYNASGNGYVIRNTITRNHRARGFLVRGANGMMEGNTIDWTQEAGIALFPEWGTWTQGGLARKVRILGNTVRRAALMSHTNAVDISVPESPTAGALQDIEFRNNVVDSCPGANLWMTSTRGAAISGNRFLKTGVARRGVAVVNRSDAVTVQGNCVEGSSPEAALKTTGVTGLSAAGAFEVCGPLSAQRDGAERGPRSPGFELLLAGAEGGFDLPAGRYRVRLYDTHGRLTRSLLAGPWSGGRFPLGDAAAAGAQLLRVEPLP